MFHTLDRKSCDQSFLSSFFSRTWRLIYFFVDQSFQELIYRWDKAYLRIDIEYDVIIFTDIYN